MLDTITLAEALTIMHNTDKHGNPELFDITFCSCDRTTQRGGEIIELTQVHTTNIKPKLPNNQSKASISTTPTKAQNHFKNRTINLYSPVAQRFFKIHRDLILKFNSKLLIW